MSFYAITTVTSAVPTATTGTVTFDVAAPSSLPAVPFSAWHYPQLRNDASGVTRSKQAQKIRVTGVSGSTVTAVLNEDTTGRAISFGDIIDADSFNMPGLQSITARGATTTLFGTQSNPVLAFLGEGTAADPATALDTSTLVVKRRAAMASATGSSAAIWAEHVNNGVDGSGQPVAVEGVAFHLGVGDSCAFIAGAETRGLAGSTYGYFALAGLYNHTCLISNATPAVVTVTAHGLNANREVQFGVSSGGGLPNGITAGTRYFVKTVLTANTFTISTSPGGAAVNTTSAGSGTFYISGNGTYPLNPVTYNDSGMDFGYTGSGTNTAATIALQALLPGSGRDHLNGTGILFYASGGRWSEGIVFEAAIVNQTMWDKSNAVTSFKITGSHTDGVDASGGTFSGFQFKMADNSGLVMAGSDPVVKFDTGDFLLYAKAGNTLGMTIGSVLIAYFASDGFHVPAGKDLFKDGGSAYTNPDYVFEQWRDGRIERFKDNPGASGFEPRDLRQMEAYTRSNLRLPRIGDEAVGAFARTDLLLEHLEQAYIYIFELEHRLSVVEAA